MRDAAARAKAEGATRFCMGGAWRDVPDGPAFDRLLEMVGAVRSLGLEACLTVGMLRRDQAERLAEAGLSAYNHNLDTGADRYGEIVTTRTYDDRLATLEHVREAGIDVCCGGILGLGETEGDRVDLLHRLATFDPHPESVPINLLVPVEGTPLAGQDPVDPLELVRCVAVARILMPSRPHPPLGRAPTADRRRARALLPRRRQLDLRRRPPADDAQRRGRARRGDARGARPAQDDRRRARAPRAADAVPAAASPGS